MLKQFFLIFSIIIVTLAQEADIQNEFSQDALLAHNLYRKIHGVPPLKLNNELSKIALQRAQELTNLGALKVKQNKFKDGVLGETVGSVEGFAEYNGISATQLWYSVVSKFDEDGENSAEGASFTQIIWKGTQEVGFGISKTSEGKFFFVAEYFPGGNVRGQYENNVFQLTDELVNQVAAPVPCVKTSVSEIVKFTKDNKSSNQVVKTTAEPEVVNVELPVVSTRSPIEEEQVVNTKRVKVLLETKTEQEIVNVKLPVVSTSSSVEEEQVTTTKRVNIVHETTTEREVVSDQVLVASTEVSNANVESSVISTRAPIEEEQVTTTKRVKFVLETTTEQEVVNDELAVVSTRAPIEEEQVTTSKKVKVLHTTISTAEQETETVELTTKPLPVFKSKTRILFTTTVDPVELESTTEVLGGFVLEEVKKTTSSGFLDNDFLITTQEVLTNAPELKLTTEFPFQIKQAVTLPKKKHSTTTTVPTVEENTVTEESINVHHAKILTTTEVVDVEVTTKSQVIRVTTPKIVITTEAEQVGSTTVQLRTVKPEPIQLGSDEKMNSEPVRVIKASNLLRLKLEKTTVTPIEEETTTELDKVEETTTVLPLKSKKLAKNVAVRKVTEPEVAVEETTEVAVEETTEVAVEETTEVAVEETTEVSNLKRLTLSKKQVKAKKESN